MTYTIKTTSESSSYTVTDLSLNSELSVRFVGKGYVGYGQVINTNLLQMLEHFANTTAPGNPLVGQLWYDTSVNRVKVFNGLDFVEVAPNLTRLTYSTIGNLLLSTSNITGEITNGNVGIAANGTGIVNINRLALLGTTVNRVLFTAANGMVMTNSMQYTPTSDTLTVANVNATNIAGSLTTAAQTAITSVGTLTSLIVSGTSRLTGTVTASTVTAATVNALNIGNTGATITGTHNGTHNGALNGPFNGTVGATTANTGAFTTVTATDSSGAVSSTQILNVVNGVYSAGFVPRAGSGTSNGLTAVNDSLLVFSNGTMGTGNLTIAPWAGATSGIRIQSVANVSTVTLAGNVTTTGNITPSANITYNLGSVTANWNNVYAVTFAGTSTTAKYADLAEIYESDQNYLPGTVVEFGGEFEITEAKLTSKRIAGVISTNPAYLMNSEAKGKIMLPVALQGRVPCKVIGPIHKGDMLVSAGDGHAISSEDPKVGTVVGKALENMLGGSGVIEVVVGRC